MLNACACFIYKFIYLKILFFCKYFAISVEVTEKYHRRNYKDCCKTFPKQSVYWSLVEHFYC